MILANGVRLERDIHRAQWIQILHQVVFFRRTFTRFFKFEDDESSNILKSPTLGSFTNYVDKILAFFDHLPLCVDIFYRINVDKKWTFLDHLPTSSFRSI